MTQQDTNVLDRYVAYDDPLPPPLAIERQPTERAPGIINNVAAVETA